MQKSLFSIFNLAKDKLTSIFSPLYFVMKKIYSIHTEKKLSIPCREIDENWTSFDLYSFDNVKHFNWLPTLINIIRGELSFVGSPPRSEEEVRNLPDEWRTLYQKTKVGMITLCDLTHGNQASEDEQYACETFYAVQGGFLFDLELFFRWVVS